eukprot:6186449-Pleurochrysis_carterae.AAC.3
MASADSCAALTAPQHWWPITTTSLTPRYFTAKSIDAAASAEYTLPALRTTKRLPAPCEKCIGRTCSG